MKGNIANYAPDELLDKHETEQIYNNIKSVQRENQRASRELYEEYMKW